jgi:uncharacterized cupin superfamily protein
MIQGFDAFAVQADLEPLPPEKALSNGVETGFAEVLADVGLEVGVWRHSPGHSTDSFDGEVFIVLEGSGTVTDAEGNVLELRPGVVGVLHSYDVTTWEIREPLRKVWVVPTG